LDTQVKKQVIFTSQFEFLWLVDETLNLHGVFWSLRYTYGTCMVHDVLGGLPRKNAWVTEWNLPKQIKRCSMHLWWRNRRHRPEDREPSAIGGGEWSFFLPAIGGHFVSSPPRAEEKKYVA